MIVATRSDPDPERNGDFASRRRGGGDRPGARSASAAMALYDYEEDAETIARKAMKIAADICVYTNDQLTLETIEDAA